jgi:hypothetical protein
MGYNTCSINSLTFVKWCYWGNGIEDCECLCDSSQLPGGYIGSVSYAYAPTNSIVVETYQCSAVCSTPTPTPTPTPTATATATPVYCHNPPTFCYNEQDYCECETWGGVWWEENCECDYFSPVIVDTSGNGIALTSAQGGVQFDLNGDGAPDQLAWTSVDSDDAWLALDRNGNGLMDNGTELFGNFTEQPTLTEGAKKNGFLALAEFDKVENGGNADNNITDSDIIFGGLRLWTDSNHNGISENDELKTLAELGVTVIELKYRESKRTDEHGNNFRYRAKVGGANVGRWAWDVFLKMSRN